MEAALNYAKELVSFESSSYLSNLPVSDHVERTLKKLGFITERIEFDDEDGVPKASIVGKKGEGIGGMAYFGHTDVVPAYDWFSSDHGAFEPTVVGNKLYGRGSCDMKGSIACMFAASAAYSADQLQKPIYITCTADEEVGYGGARQVVERSELYREMVTGNSHGIVGEPTLLEVVYAHKGTCGIIATSNGRAAHSSTSEGINANLAMIPFLAEMKAIHDETTDDPKWHNEEFDPPTISWNIGVNDHTRAINITPPQSICTVYFRPMPGQDPEVLIERSQQAAQQCELDFKVMRASDPLYVDPNSEFVQSTLELVGKERARTVSYGTDGGVLSEMKNLLVIGPGDIAQAHTNDEWIALEQFEKGTALYRKMIEHWCC